MFYFGEFSDYEKKHYCISWITSDDTETHILVKNAFRIISPDIMFYETGYDEMLEFRLEWKLFSINIYFLIFVL